MQRKRSIFYFLLIIAGMLLFNIFFQYNSKKQLKNVLNTADSMSRYANAAGLIRDIQVNMLANEIATRQLAITKDQSITSEVNRTQQKMFHSMELLQSLLRNSNNKLLLMKTDTLIEQHNRFINSIISRGNIKDDSTIEKSYENNTIAKRVASITNLPAVVQEKNFQQIALEEKKSESHFKMMAAIQILVNLLFCVFLLFCVCKGEKSRRELSLQYEQSQEKALEASVAKQNFMANISHEIRTPLNAIVGFTDLLKQEQLNTKAKEFAGCIGHSSEILLTIVNDVLDFSKIEAGMMHIESNPFRLREVLDSVKNMFAERVNQKNIRLVIDVEKSVPQIMSGDAGRLTQIMINLINNAVKFTKAGGIYVRVVAEKKTDEQIDVSFSVKDTGIGIPANKMHTIFERFQQVDDDITRKYGGTGLGLAIVRQLVELQNGSINASTVQDMGTEFFFTIPYSFCQEYIQQEIAGQYLWNETLPDANDFRILVVEDNEMNQHLIKHLLSNWQINHLLVNNGAEAIESLSRERFDLVLMDIQMPYMDGHTATRIIRSEMNNSIPIIAMTAHTMEDEREKCLSEGMDEYISKPIRAQELHRIIQLFIKLSSGSNYGGNGSSDQTKKIINLDYLQELSAGDTHFEIQMLEQFLENVPLALDSMQSALHSENTQELHRIAHNLKTSLSFAGLNTTLAEKVKYLETNLINDRNYSIMKKKINSIIRTCEMAYPEVLFYLEEIMNINTDLVKK